MCSDKGKLPYIPAHYAAKAFHHDYNNNQMGNILNRIRNLVVEAINAEVLLPKAIVIVLNDDMLDALDHYQTGISISIGRMVEWEVNEIHSIVAKHKENLPSRSSRFKYPMIL